ncbi:hypothetical protein QE152_g13380 [Popillia japonica]|uniref:Uncharacterized protein n=1 Tax=Popillia japonica TaxID=7064 RepID=A0AAW1LC22_POPJA
MAQIKNLQRLLERRRNNKKLAKRKLFKTSNRQVDSSPPKASPIDMDTSFCSTASLVRTICANSNSSRKRKSSPSPSQSPRRFKVSAMIHSADDSHSAADQTGLGQSVLGRTGTSSPANPQQNPSSRRCPELPKRSLRAPVASPSSRSLQNTKAKISAPISAPMVNY